MNLLDVPPLIRPKYTHWMSRAERFTLFNDLNPHLAPLLAREAILLKSKGATQWGIQGIFNVVRFNRTIATIRVDTGEALSFKLSNDLSPYYARYLMKKWPELEGFFVLKPLKDGEPIL